MRTERKSFFKYGILKTISLPQVIIVLYVIWNAISALKSPYGKDTWIGQGRYEGMFSVLLYAGVFLSVSTYGKKTVWFERCLIIFAIFHSLICISQFLGSRYCYGSMSYWQLVVSFVGTIGNIDCVGGVNSIVIPVLFCFYVLKDEKYWDWAALVGLFLSFMVFNQIDVDSQKLGILAAFVVGFPFLLAKQERLPKIFAAVGTICFSFFIHEFCGLRKDDLLKKGFGFHFSMSKTVLFFLLMGVVCGCAAYLLHRIIKKKNVKFKFYENKPLAKIWIIWGVLLLLGVLFVYFYKGDYKLLREAAMFMHGQIGDKIGTYRGYIWKASVKIAKEMPIFGSGPGTFLERYRQYEIFDTTTDFAHNDFLQIAVCIGFVGMFIYIAFLISLAYGAIKLACKDSDVVIFASAVAGYIAHSFFSFSIAIVTPLFWVAAGIVENQVRQYRAETFETSGK